MANEVAKVARWDPMGCFRASYWVVGRILSNKVSFRVAHTKVVRQTALGKALLSLAFTFTKHVQGFLGGAKKVGEILDRS